MRIFGRKKPPQQPSGRKLARQALSRRTPPPGSKPPPKPPKLTKEQQERKLLEEFANWQLAMVLEGNEELVRYIGRHLDSGGHFVIKKLINKRAVRSVALTRWPHFPTLDMVEDWVFEGHGLGPGVYVVLPNGKNRILARYEIDEVWHYP